MGRCGGAEHGEEGTEGSTFFSNVGMQVCRGPGKGDGDRECDGVGVNHWRG